MSLGRFLGKLLLFGVIEVGVYFGVPVRREDIEKLLEVMNRTRVVQIVKKEKKVE